MAYVDKFKIDDNSYGTIVTGGDIHIYDAPVETIKIVGK
jgi:hypothetical protein